MAVVDKVLHWTICSVLKDYTHSTKSRNFIWGYLTIILAFTLPSRQQDENKSLHFAIKARTSLISRGFKGETYKS